ncbi:hypothetical protein K525DRAFT_203236 [Schizophyllum commune Loenen D]|nr:hypothetical protein K525DRAFT_203236 [Schizophyllum commune Loenen D]
MYACQPVAARLMVYLMRPAWFSNVVLGLSHLPHVQGLSRGRIRDVCPSLPAFFQLLAPPAILRDGRECLLLLRLGVMALFVDANGDPSPRIATHAVVV